MSDLSTHKHKEITQILTSLYYLSKEAKSADLTEIAQLIRQCIKNIEDWSKSGGENISQLVVNEETFHILEFLTAFTQVTPKTRQNFLSALAPQTVN